MRLFSFLLIFALPRSGGTSDWPDSDNDSEESEIDPERVVDSVTENFEKIVESTVDVSEKLKLISETASTFLKLAIPMGKILAASLDIVSEKESAEYKAIMKMHSAMDYQFKMMNARLEGVVDGLDLKQRFLEFAHLVTDRFDALQPLLKRFMNPAVRKSPAEVKRLVLACSENQALYGVAVYIRRVTCGTCPTGKPRTKQFGLMQHIFLDLARDFKIHRKWTPEEESLKRRIWNVVSSMPGHDGLIELHRLRRLLYGKLHNNEERLHDWQSLNSTLTRMLKKVTKGRLQETDTDVYTGCLTDLVLEEKDYNRNMASHYSTMIQIELSRLMLATNMCSHFMCDGEITCIEGSLTDMTEIVVEVSRFLKNYIPQKLNETPLFVESVVVKKYLHKAHQGGGNIPVDEHWDMLKGIAEALEFVGPEELRRQVLVTPQETAEKDDSVRNYYKCPNYWCTLIERERGHDIIIARFHKNHFNFASEITKTVMELEAPVKNILRTSYFEKLPDIVKKINRRSRPSSISPMMISCPRWSSRGVKGRLSGNVRFTLLFGQ